MQIGQNQMIKWMLKISAPGSPGAPGGGEIGIVTDPHGQESVFAPPLQVLPRRKRRKRNVYKEKYTNLPERPGEQLG